MHVKNYLYIYFIACRISCNNKSCLEHIPHTHTRPTVQLHILAIHVGSRDWCCAFNILCLIGKDLVFECTMSCLSKLIPTCMCYRCWFGGQEQACRPSWHTPAYHTPCLHGLMDLFCVLGLYKLGAPVTVLSPPWRSTGEDTQIHKLTLNVRNQ